MLPDQSLVRISSRKTTSPGRSRSISRSCNGCSGRRIPASPLRNSPARTTGATSVPISQGGLKLDRGLSDHDRTHRLTIVYLWTIPGPRSGWIRHAFGGWPVAGITTFQSGTPFTAGNGFDRNDGGVMADRPDIGNANAPLNTRAMMASQCATGYQNPDTGSCVTPGACIGWRESGFRMPPRWGGILCIPQVPQMSVGGTPEGRFLNRDFTDSGIRSMWVRAKVVF